MEISNFFLLYIARIIGNIKRNAPIESSSKSIENLDLLRAAAAKSMGSRLRIPRDWWSPICAKSRTLVRLPRRCQRLREALVRYSTVGRTDGRGGRREIFTLGLSARKR